MSENLYDALEVCLEALETGADPGSAVKLYPELEEELLPLLEISRQAQSLAISQVPGTVIRRGKARVLQHAAGMRAESVRKHRARFVFPRLAVALTLTFLIFFSGTGLVRASNGALPGDHLYPVKRTWEDVRLLLVANPASREELESEFEQERLHEIDELLAEGRHETIAFAGVVTEQNGDLWVVSGVTVQIMPESRLPAIPVTVGASVKLQGRTNAQGFVEADYIEMLSSKAILPTSVPTQIETQDDYTGSGLEENSNDHEDESALETSSDDKLDNHNNENDRDEREVEEDRSSGHNENDSDEDKEDKSDESERREESDDSKSENSGRDGGEDDSGDDEDD